MSKFFVGQLVRIVYSISGNFGKEAVVSGFDRNVKIQGMGIVDNAMGVYIGEIEGWGPFEWFEPILYDGAQPIAESFEEMMGKLREGVVA